MNIGEVYQCVRGFGQAVSERVDDLGERVADCLYSKSEPFFRHKDLKEYKAEFDLLKWGGVVLLGGSALVVLIHLSGAPIPGWLITTEVAGYLGVGLILAGKLGDKFAQKQIARISPLVGYQEFGKEPKQEGLVFFPPYREDISSGSE